MNNKDWLHKKPDSVLDWTAIVFACITFYVLLQNLDALTNGIGVVLRILSPFAGGIVVAYVLDPMVRFFQKNLMKNNPRLRWLSILLAYLAGVLILSVLVRLVVPQVLSSIVSLTNNLPAYVQGIETGVLHLQSEYGVQMPHALDFLNSYEDLLGKVYDIVMGWVPQIVSYLGSVASNFVAIFTTLAASVYMLSDKYHLLHQLRTVTRALFPHRLAENILRIFHYANENFTGFFVGKIIDSAIIGVMTFLCMTLLRLDYAVLISVIIGITNIIPVFGPFIGAVPSVVILLFVEPLQALIFTVLILIIQQVDGNFIGPKILGNRVGVSALWVLFSIVLGGDLLGVVGMVIGVPVFATLYGLAQEGVAWLLDRRGIDAEGRPREQTPPAGEAPPAEAPATPAAGPQA